MNFFLISIIVLIPLLANWWNWWINWISCCSTTATTTAATNDIKKTSIIRTESNNWSWCNEEKTNTFVFIINIFLSLFFLFFIALVLKNYVYRRHLSLSGSSGPPSPAMSTSSTDDGLIKVFLEIFCNNKF